ncbi:MAG: WecB/TagA/CpsF family glycosyltransferase [Acidimicrobiales bacterium]
MNRATSHVDGLTRVELFGLRFVDDTSIVPVADRVLAGHAEDVGALPLVVTPNTDLLLQVVNDPDDGVRHLYGRAWCVLPDGQPIVWASRLLGARLRYRLTGSDLFAELWPRLVATSTPVFVLAPSAAVATGLERSHPGARALVAPLVDAGSHAEIVELATRCVAEITEARAEVVILSLGHPKDSLIAEEIFDQLGAASFALPFVLCLGGSAEMYLGIRKRAPKWVQRCSAEWLYRFAQEPRRLFFRYFIRDSGFLLLVAREYRARRRAA